MNKYAEIFEKLQARYGIEDDDDEALELLAFLRSMPEAPQKPLLTETGVQILSYMQDGHDKNNKAKDIAEGMGISSRKVAGAMRKLVTDGFVEKFGQSPVVYSLSEKGINFNISEFKGE